MFRMVKVGVREKVRSDLRLEGGEGFAAGCARGWNAGTEGAVHIRGNTQKPGGMAQGPEREY